MAARRLVIVMLILLAISTLAAALLPPPARVPTTSTPQPRRNQKEPRSAYVPRPVGVRLLLVGRMRVSGRPPKTLRIERGDQLRLEVTAGFGDDIEIPALGRTAPVTPFAPASFDLLATRRGSFAVQATHTGRLAGWLLFAKPGSGRCGVATPEALRGRGSTPPCSRHGRPGSADRARSSRRPSAAAGRQRR